MYNDEGVRQKMRGGRQDKGRITNINFGMPVFFPNGLKKCPLELNNSPKHIKISPFLMATSILY